MAGFLNRLLSKGPFEVHFEGKTTVEVERGTTLMEAADLAKVELDRVCEGNCSCSTCKVLVLKGAKNLSRMNDDEREVLGKKMVEQGHRLSCQTQVKGPVHVQIPEYF